MKTPKKKHILMWLLTIFMAITVLVYFPSVTSIIALIFVVIALPIESLQNFWADHGLRGFVKGIILCAAFIGAVMAAPPQSTADDVSKNTPPVVSAEVARTMPSEDVEPSQAPELTPTPEPTPTPTPEPTPAPPQAAEPEAPSSAGSTSSGGGGGNGDGSNFNTYNNESQQDTTQTWVLNTSTMKIHYPTCKSVKKIAPQNYATSNATESELLARGYTRCGQCH